jgi:multidrug efflux pump subunit AcrA (membrane-fusion protein)
MVFVSLALIIIVLSGCSATTSSDKNDATPTPIPPPPIPEKPTYTVKSGLVVDSLSFTGRVAPVIEEELFFRETGRVKKVYVERNQMIEEGTLLGELENDDLLRQLAQAELDLEAAEINLKEAQASRQYSIDIAEIDLKVKKLQAQKTAASLESLDLDLQVAELDLEEAKTGASADAIAISQLRLERAKNSLWSAQVSRDSTCRFSGAACDSAQASVNRAEADVRIAEIELAQLQRGASPEDLLGLEVSYNKILQSKKKTEIDLEIQQQQIEIAEMGLAKLKAGVDPQLTKAVERSKLSLERLMAQVENSRVVSPIAGKVSSISAFEGRTVNAYRPVFIVADEGELEITAEPMSSQMQRLSEGMAAIMVLSAYPGKELPGEIITLPYPYGSGGGASLEEADKATHVSFDPLDLDLGPGDLVKVIITLERKESALWLPPAAIRTFAGRQFVVIQEGAQQRRADVVVGIRGAERVEVVEGLEEGQIVIGQ